MPAAIWSPSSARTSPGILRFDIAFGKAWGALGMGFGSRTLAEPRAEIAVFFTTLAAASDGRFVPNPGGVLIRDAAGDVIGAVGISGDTSDKDEVCARGRHRGRRPEGRPGRQQELMRCTMRAARELLSHRERGGVRGYKLPVNDFLLNIKRSRFPSPQPSPQRGEESRDRFCRKFCSLLQCVAIRRLQEGSPAGRLHIGSIFDRIRNFASSPPTATPRSCTDGSKSLSLRQSFCDQHSPLGFRRAESANNHGLRAKTSALRGAGRGPKFSLSARLSLNLPHFADLVRIS